MMNKKKIKVAFRVDGEKWNQFLKDAVEKGSDASKELRNFVEIRVAKSQKKGV